MNAPTVTDAQILSVIGAILGLLAAFTLIDDATSKAIAGAAAVIMPVVWTIADSIIRQGRAKAIAAGAQVSHDGKLIPPAPTYAYSAPSTTGGVGT